MSGQDNGREQEERVLRREFLRATAATVAVGSLVAAVPAATQMSFRRKIRLGVVGGDFGVAFQWHLEPNCEVLAVSDLITGRRQALQRVYKCNKAYASLEQLVLDPKIEAVAVFTGAPDHARHVIECMKHGKHVISAVPACVTLEEAHALKEIKERTGLRYMMAETSYYRWPTMLARQYWAEKKFGRFLYSEVEYYHDHDLKNPIGSTVALYRGKPTPRGWRHGYPPMLYPTHSAAFHVGVTRERFTAVSCLGWGDNSPAWKDNPYDNPFLNQVALFRTTGASICRCNVFWKIHAGGERAQWLGEDLSIYMASDSGQPFVVKTRGGKDIRVLPDFFQVLPGAMRVPSEHGNSHAFLTHEFAAALVEDREPAVDLYEALAMTVPGIVAMESARKAGEQLKIPSFDRA